MDDSDTLNKIGNALQTAWHRLGNWPDTSMTDGAYPDTAIEAMYAIEKMTQEILELRKKLDGD